MSTDSPPWRLITCAKQLQFFIRIERLLRGKTKPGRNGKRPGGAIPESINRPRGEEAVQRNNNTEGGEGNQRMKLKRREEEERTDDRILQGAVKRLHFGRWEEKEAAAEEMIKLMMKREKGERVKIAKKLVGELGVVQSLVTMAQSEVVTGKRSAVRLLTRLANGSYTNKATMVEAGILADLPKQIDMSDQSTVLEFAQLLLSLSSLANTQFPIPSTEALPFLISILDSSSHSTSEAKEACLGALLNLSTILENAAVLTRNDSTAVPTLLKLSMSKETSEKALGTLGNLAVTSTGKKAMERSPLVPEGLAEVLTWEEKPRCQELSVYLLMILAHRSWSQRRKMSESRRLVPALLQVALLGSPLARKRAVKLLQWFEEERHAMMGPQAEGEKKLMGKMVKDSLDMNMEVITRRANDAPEESSGHKSLVVSSSSKSLPY